MSELAARIVEALDDAVWSVDREQRITLWNRKLAALTALAARDVLGRPIFEIMPAWRTSEQPHLERALAGAASQSPAFPLAATGRFEASYRALDGGALAVIRDVSSTYRDREQLLQESDARFQIMADHAPVLLWMTGTDARCTFVNQPWLAFTGRRLEDELGDGWAEGVHHEDFMRCMDTYLGAFVRRQSFRMEYRLRRADGAYRWLLDTGVPRFLPSGEFAGFLGSCIDVTEGKLAHAELDRRVRERTAELEAFAYSVSHDLRSPLRAIDGFSLALLEDHADQLDVAARRHLARLRESAQHMDLLIDALLKLSRVGRSTLHRSRVDLSLLARELVAAYAAREPERTVAADIAADLVVDGDPTLLRIALDNLLGNAWKFTSKAPNAEIAMTGDEGNSAVTVSIRDNGPGFDMAQAPKLFRPFQRLHGREYPGTGVGLATVQRIVHRHGGAISAVSSPGHGATFSFTIPARRDDG